MSEHLCRKLAVEVLSLRAHTKIYHWNAQCYSTHVALDQLLTAMNKLGDRCVETCIGIVGRPLEFSQSHRIELGSVVVKPRDYLKNAVDKFKDLHVQFKGMTDIRNIIDEIIGSLHRTIYLLKMR